MATIYPTTFTPVPSTPSGSSQSSLPPSYAITVHDHVLPPGWQCKYDPKTGKYYFLNDHISQWDIHKPGQYGPTSSPRSSPSHSFTRYFQPFSSRYKANETMIQRLVKMFPEYDEHYITNLLKIYHNRENLVISALITEGYSRQYQSIPDEALYYKLKSYFPTVESETIRALLSKHNNVEHEVIGNIIASLAPNHSRYQSMMPGSPKMKLRYLKLMYPDADETVLFDLLYNCDQNAQQVIDRLDKMGYKRKDRVGIGRPSSAKVESLSGLTSDFMKPVRPKTVPVSKKQTSFPPSVADKIEIYERLQESFPKADRVLINMALESASFDENRAKLFLNAMTPQDSEKYLPTDLRISEQLSLTLLTRGTQTNAFVETILGTPITTKRILDFKCSQAGTWTGEDGIIIEEKKKPLAKGPNATLRRGANILNLIKSFIPWKGSDSKNRQGPDASNRKGPDSANRDYSSGKAKGPDPKNRKGPKGSAKKKS